MLLDVIIIISILILSVVSAILGALGGQHDITIRRLGVPGVITLGSLLLTFSPWAVLLMGMFGGLSMGYGLPSFNGPNGSMDDEGSVLGKMVWKIVPKEFWANVIVRSLVGLITMIPVAIYTILIHGSVIKCVEGIVVVILVDGFLSWEGWGSIKLFGKNLIVTDLVYYGVVALAAFYIIHK